MLLSRYEPADAVCPQDGVRGEAHDKEHREDQQPVDAPHWDTGEWAQAVCICHVSVGVSFKPWSTNSYQKITCLMNCLVSLSHQKKLNYLFGAIKLSHNHLEGPVQSLEP